MSPLQFPPPLRGRVRVGGEARSEICTRMRSGPPIPTFPLKGGRSAPSVGPNVEDRQ
jgi:hypothetical protein